MNRKVNLPFVAFLGLVTAALPAFSSVTLHGPRFDVTASAILPEEQSFSRVGDTVYWSTNVSVASAADAEDNVGSSGEASASMMFVPKGRFVIKGYTVTYNFGILVSEYVVQPGDDALTDAYAPGTVLHTSSATVNGRTYTQTGDYSFSEFVAGPQLDTLDVLMFAAGGLAMCTVKDPVICLNSFGSNRNYAYAYSRVSFGSATVVPDIALSPVPEPATVTFLGAGLMAIACFARNRRFARQPEKRA